MEASSSGHHLSSSGVVAGTSSSGQASPFWSTLLPHKDIEPSDASDFSIYTIIEKDLYWMYLCIRTSVDLQDEEGLVEHFKRHCPLAYSEVRKFCDRKWNGFELSKEEIDLHAQELGNVFKQRLESCGDLANCGYIKRAQQEFRSAEVARDIYVSASNVWYDREVVLHNPDASTREEVWMEMISDCNTAEAIIDSSKMHH